MDTQIADFLAHLADRNRSQLTIRRYGETLRRFVRFARQELHANEVSPAKVDKALVVLFLREGDRTQASPSTRNSRLAALRAFFHYLVAEERLERDPSALVSFSALPQKTPTFLTPEEFEKLRSAVERTATDHYRYRDVAIITTLWHTGLRLGELLSLNLDQVDFPAERFRGVRRKGGDTVDVHFNVEVTIALRRWIFDRNRYPNAPTEHALFFSDRGKRISARAVQDIFVKYVRVAGLGKRVTPHSLHSTATALIRLGHPIEVVAEVLHHRSLDTTRHYVHLVGKEVHAAVASLAGERQMQRKVLS